MIAVVLALLIVPLAAAIACAFRPARRQGGLRGHRGRWRRLLRPGPRAGPRRRAPGPQLPVLPAGRRPERHLPAGHQLPVRGRGGVLGRLHQTARGALRQALLRRPQPVRLVDAGRADDEQPGPALDRGRGHHDHLGAAGRDRGHRRRRRSRLEVRADRQRGPEPGPARHGARLLRRLPGPRRALQPGHRAAHPGRPAPAAHPGPARLPARAARLRHQGRPVPGAHLAA